MKLLELLILHRGFNSTGLTPITKAYFFASRQNVQMISISFKGKDDTTS